MRDKDITLITEYKNGSKIELKETQICAGEKSVSRSEYYAAYASGLRAQIIFEIYKDEYEMASVQVDDKYYVPKFLKYKGRRMEILRTYASGKNMEVTASYVH